MDVPEAEGMLVLLLFLKFVEARLDLVLLCR